MQKKLLVAAVAGALFAPAVMAQSTVTLSGSVRPSFDFVRASGTTGPAVAGATTNVSKTTLSDNTSRFLLSGTEDLGGGLKAEFNVGVRFNVDAGTTGTTATAGFVQREIFAGLAGTWGAIRMGNQANAFDDATLDGSVMQPINGTTLHAANNLLGNYGSTVWGAAAVAAVAGTAAVPVGSNAVASDAGTAISTDNRLANSIKYLTPVFGGFQGSIQYVTSEGKTGAAASDNSGWVLGGDYSAGPLRLLLAHQNLRNGQGTNNAAGYTGGTFNAAFGTIAAAAGVAAAAGDNKIKGTRGAAVYNFGTFQLGGILEQINLSSSVGEIKRNAWEIAGLVEFGQSQVFANYTRALKSKGISQTGAGVDDAAKFLQLGYKYLLSKRTQAYAVYSRLDNNAGATYSQGIAGYTYKLGNQDSSAFSIGLKHDF